MRALSVTEIDDQLAESIKRSEQAVDFLRKCLLEIDLQTQHQDVLLQRRFELMDDER